MRAWPPPTAADRPPGPVRIALYGDSIAVEAEGAFALMLTASGRAELRTRVAGGTAICDFFDTMRADLVEFRPDAVVMEFSGNALTGCVHHEPFTTAEYYRRYRADADAVMALYEPAGIPVYWVGPPLPRPRAGVADDWGLLNVMYSRIPDQHAGAAYVDAGQAVLRDGAYTDYLPCLFYEPCEGSPDPATGEPANRVRGPDGVHFCPVHVEPTEGADAGCPVWSSGAWRFGLAMAEPLVRDFALDGPPVAG
jgi:hypothetical protein